MFLAETASLLGQIDQAQVAEVQRVIRETPGRIFFVGNGGGAGHASHAACDFRKIGGKEAYCVNDNVSELTARANDDGWDTVYSGWLEASRISWGDLLFVFSVGGGDDNVSRNLVQAIDTARVRGAKVSGIVGAAGGHVARYAKACVVVPSFSTPQVEGIQAVLWHLLCLP